MALRLAGRSEVLIGSRSAQRGEEVAAELTKLANRTVAGDTNLEVARKCDVGILAIPDTMDLGFLDELADPLSGKLVISPIVPIAVVQGRFVHARERGSAAEVVSSALPKSRVAAALHTVPAITLADSGKSLDFDVLVCADSREVFKEAADVISIVAGLRPLYAGRISNAREVESLTPLILNLAKLNGLKRLSIKLVE